MFTQHYDATHARTSSSSSSSFPVSHLRSYDALFWARQHANKSWSSLLSLSTSSFSSSSLSSPLNTKDYARKYHVYITHIHITLLKRTYSYNTIHLQHICTTTTKAPPRTRDEKAPRSGVSKTSPHRTCSRGSLERCACAQRAFVVPCVRRIIHIHFWPLTLGTPQMFSCFHYFCRRRSNRRCIDANNFRYVASSMLY